MKRKFTLLAAAFALLTFLAVPMGMRGQTTYQLQQVTSVEDGGLYVFEQDGHVMNNTISSKALQTTNTFSTTGLMGTETYVWTLETATNGYYLKNVNLTSSQYLNNSSSTEMSFGDKTSIWSFNFQTDQTVLIQNNSNSNRFLGYTTSTSYLYKAYATSNLTSYPHAIKVYKLVEGGSTPTTYDVTFDAGDGTFVGNTDFPNASNTVAAGTYTLPSATPATGYTFDGWVATGITTPITGSYTVSGAVAFTAHYTQNTTSGTATYTITSISAVSTSGQAPAGSSATFSQTYGTKFQMTSGNSMTLTLSGYQGKVVTGITLNMKSNGSSGAGWMYAKAGNNTLASIGSENNGVAFSDNQWNGSYTSSYTDVTIGMSDDAYAIQDDENLVIFIKATQNSLYCQSFTITYESASSITRPQFSPAGGIYTSAQSVTISAESGADIYYTTDGSQPSTTSTQYTGTINITSTTTLKAIAVVSGVSSNVASATYTIITPLTTMQAIYDNAVATPASHEVYVTLDSWVITGHNGGTSSNYASTAWLTDGVKGCQIYGTSPNYPKFNAGDVLSGTIVCNLQLYNGSARITGITSSTTNIINGHSIVTTGGSVTPNVTTIGNLGGVNTGSVVTFNHLRCTDATSSSTNIYLSDGTNTIVAKKTMFPSLSLSEGKLYNLTGVYDYSTSSQTIYPRSGADVVEASKATLTINTEHVAEYFVFDETYSVTVENNSAQVYVGTEVKISIEMEENYFVESLTVTDGNSQSVEVTELTPGVYYSFTMPATGASIAVTAREAAKYALTFGEHSHVTFTITDEESVEISDLTQIYEGATVNVETTVETGYYLQSLNVTYGDNQTAEITTNAPDHYSFTMPSGNAVLSSTVRDAAIYTLVTSLGDLMPGNHYIIVGENDGDYYAMGVQKSNNRAGVSVALDNGVITETEGVYEFVISGPTVGLNVPDKFTIYDNVSNNKGYLYAASSTANHLKTENTLDDNGKWTIAIDNEGVATLRAQGSNSRDYMRFNYNNGSPLFACYDENSSTGTLPYLYKKVDDKELEIYSPTSLSADYQITVPANGILTVKEGGISNTTPANLIVEDGGQLITSSSNLAATVKKNVEKANNWGTGEYTPDGWYFVALPLNSDEVTPSMLTTGDYDLYRLNPNNTMWENYKNPEHQDGFKLANGEAYLYANNAGFTINFAGTVKASAASQDVSVSTGWNLVGNPFTYNTYLNRAYYKMNEDRNGIEIVNNNAAIAPCTGVIVKATTEDHVTFTQTAQSVGANHGNVQMVLAQTITTRGESSSQTLDNAIVSFNEDSQLEKFYFGTQNANIFIPQGNEEYAIVSAEAQGEMPVSFVARTQGTYTLTVNAEGVEMDYLHLIDNLTGIDTDLLQTPSYTFEAKTSDYESRFRLMFAANNEDGSSTGSETFSFYSNGNLIINNEGNATLQVIDALGRILSNESISGTVSKSIDAPAGVYVLRLINGENVKTQKIVVR